MKDDTWLFPLAIVLGLAVAAVAVKLALWPIRRPRPEPTVRLEDYSLSNFGGEPYVPVPASDLMDWQLVTPGTHELPLKDNGSTSSTGDAIQLPLDPAPVESTDLCR